MKRRQYELLGPPPGMAGRKRVRRILNTQPLSTGPIAPIAGHGFYTGQRRNVLDDVAHWMQDQPIIDKAVGGALSGVEYVGDAFKAFGQDVKLNLELGVDNLNHPDQGQRDFLDKLQQKDPIVKEAADAA